MKLLHGKAAARSLPRADRTPFRISCHPTHHQHTMLQCMDSAMCPPGAMRTADMCFDSVVCAYRHRRRCHGKGHRRNQRAQSHRKDPFRFWAPHTHSFLFHVSSARFCSKNMFSLSRLFFFGITNMIGVDSCVFLIFTDKSLPENQTKRGEIDFFRTISKVLVYVFCSKRSFFEVVFFACHHNFWSTMAVVSELKTFFESRV